MELFYILLHNFELLMTQRFTKASNLLASGFSFMKSTITGDPRVAGMPLAISVELTNRCNLSCPECSSGSGRMTRESGFMDIGLFDRIIDELGPFLFNINLYFQGEPMMHPRFFSFVSSSWNIHTIVSTNGHFLDDGNAEKLVNSGLNELIISLDGTDQDTYSIYRKNGNFETVVRGIKAVTEAKKRYNSHLKTGIQFLVNRYNEKQIGKMRKMSSDLNIPLHLKSMQVIRKEDIGLWIPLSSRYRRYRIINGGFEINSSLPDRCGRLWFNSVITWDGKVIPCCFDKNAEYVMGDLNHDSFREIWNGPKYRIFRKSILTGRNMIEMCRNCTSGMRLRN